MLTLTHSPSNTFWFLLYSEWEVENGVWSGLVTDPTMICENLVYIIRMPIAADWAFF